MSHLQTFSSKFSKSYKTVEGAGKAMERLESRLGYGFRWILTPCCSTDRHIPVVLFSSIEEADAGLVAQLGHPVTG